MLFALLLVNCKGDGDKKTTVNKTIVDTELTNSIDRGRLVYDDFCVSCHMTNGKGVPNVFPPLADSDYLKSKREESIKAIKYGLKDEITVNGVTYNGVMTPLGLEDDEVADVMNYINYSWGNDYGEKVTQEEVSNIAE
ncbi:MAG: cytochrome c [Winogradskyella sp.]|nr:MAG: cytochrome c [Winogradskyella sp.]